MPAMEAEQGDPKMSWLKYLGAAVAAMAVFGAGYKYASAIYKEEIAQIRAEHALAAKELTDEYRAKEQSQAQQLADAWDQLERARAESDDLRSDVERVRELANGYRAKLSAAGADSCEPIRERLSRCQELLVEGSELSAEGAELSGRIAARKDALLHVVRP